MMEDTLKTTIDKHNGVTAEAALPGATVHQDAFLTEGTMVAFPTCFPGSTLPITADEGRITALDVTTDGVVYGGTSGKRVHLFVGFFRGDTGAVIDLGVINEAEHCAAICHGPNQFMAFVNGPDGGRLVGRALTRIPFSLIQEWGFIELPLHDYGLVAPGEPIVHAIAIGHGTEAVGITSDHLFLVDLETGSAKIVGQVPGAGRLAVGSQGNVFGQDGHDALWQFDPIHGTLTRQAIRLPKGNWSNAAMQVACHPHTGLLYITDGDGQLFSFCENNGFSGPCAKIPLKPIGPMAVTFDGRLFGFCGEGIARMFRYDPLDREISDLGVAVSVLQRRRYGYVFGDATVGREGELIFGENDNQGHVWLYFPRVRRVP